MFCFCNKMPYNPMSILTPRHLVGPNHGKRDPTSQTVIKEVSLSGMEVAQNNTAKNDFFG